MKNTLLFKQTKLLFLLAFALFSSLGWGQTLLINEPFDYTPSLSATTFSTQTSAAWTNMNSGDNILVTSNGLSYSGLSISAGNKISFDSAGMDTAKSFTAQNTGTIYYSFLLNINSLGSLNTTGGYLIGFNEGTGTTYGATFWTRKDSGGSGYNIGINAKTTAANTVWLSGAYSTNNTVLVVVSSQFISGTINDVVKIWINPIINGTEPTASASTTNNLADLVNISRLILRQDSTTATPFVDIDEIRVGTTWASVTPAAPITTWSGSAWSNTTGPTSSIDAIIDGTYNTANNGVFTAKSLIVNANKSFTLNASTSITVDDIVKNSGTFTIENNANLVQTYKGELNTGNIIVNRDSSILQLYDYTLWSSPVAGQKLKAFSPDTLDTRFYTYNSGTNLYNVVPTPLTTDFATATGYLIRTPNTWTAPTPTTFNGVFTGVPNNGAITISGLTSGKYYAVGNPYPSTISVADFYIANPNAGTLYFWRKTNGAGGSAYATRNNAGGVASTIGGLVPSADIAVGQGFFVSPSANMTLSFTNAMRASPSTSSVFLRTTGERNRFWLNLTNSSGLFSQMLVGYMPEATSGEDNAIDGRYINDAPTALTSLINAEEFTIQGRPLPFTTTDTVPLGFKTSVAGNYSITIDHVDGLFSAGQTVFLKDNLLNTVVDLSAGSYSFASAVGTFNSRFEVHFQGALGVNNPTFTANSAIAFGENGEIKINSGSTIMEHVRVYDLQGRLLAEKKQVNASETKIQTSATNQVLLVEITAANGSKITKKIIQ